jgi:glycosyltransferase involved in cell wall biosynthesis
MAMSHKLRLLFLTFAFPPLHCMASVRTANIAKQLSNIGWDVSVVTPHPSLWQSPDAPDRVAAELDHSGIRMIYTGYRWRCLSSLFVKRPCQGVGWFVGGIARRFAKQVGIDPRIGWYQEATRACSKLTPEQVDVIVVSGKPFGSFRVAQRLSQKLGRPYVLDYRDLWTGNPHSPPSQQERDACIEKRLLDGCSAVSVVSPSMARCLEQRFGVAGKVDVIPNGYAPSDFADVTPASFGHFAIVYTGTFYPPKRDIEPLMKALTRLAQIGLARPWRFHYYGAQGDYVQEAARRHGVERYVELHGMVPRHQCLEAVRGAGAAVVITSVDAHANLAERGIITGKIFEPIGLGTPVLVIAPPQSDLEAVVQTVGRGAVFPGLDVEGMAAFLARVMQGDIPESRKPETYAWPQLIGKMDAMLQRVIPHRSCY